MKASSLLPLLAAGIIAAPAPSSNTSASQSLKLDDTTVSTLSKGYEKYTFKLYIKEYCNIDVKFVPFKSDLHVYAEVFHDDDHKYGWDFTRGSPKTFSLDNTDISIRHNYDTSETSFEYGDCEWKDGETVDKNCGWCDQDMPWKESEDASQIDCSRHLELFRVSVDLTTPSRYDCKLTTSSAACSLAISGVRLRLEALRCSSFLPVKTGRASPRQPPMHQPLQLL